MSTAPTFQLPAPLAAAVQRVKQAARSAAERTVESLGLAAMAAHNTFQRDALLSAQFELNRKLGAFVQAFSDAFDEQVRRDCGPRGGGASGTQTANWDQLSLVEDRELEIKVAAERFGLEIAHSSAILAGWCSGATMLPARTPMVFVTAAAAAPVTAGFG